MNPVMKISILLFVTLSFICFVEALKCFQCPLFNSKGRCFYQEATCETQNNQVCVWWAKFAGGRLLYGFQECSHICVNQTLILGNNRIEMRCCNDKSFCNQF
ncbi:secreted seminal-vesicle Ly-6 protein 1-like [Mus pahari]|uniref:secreted seminal-vesicle Ly-6 protein 1-like n=1 Tax=Mus pahari TaxID=10093 RepID=UPI000A306592|nr:secreted seminal-vesicle Ly-6 protein 1-like [Mus pahari]